MRVDECASITPMFSRGTIWLCAKPQMFQLFTFGVHTPLSHAFNFGSRMLCAGHEIIVNARPSLLEQDLQLVCRHASLFTSI